MRIIQVVLIYLLLGSEVTAQAQDSAIHGSVVDLNGVPVVEVDIKAEVKGEIRSTTTDANGYFRFDLRALFDSAKVRNLKGLMLVFSKSGYRDQPRMLRLGSAEKFQIQLEPLAGSGVIDPAMKERLKNHISHENSFSLFFIPYELPSLGSGLSAEEFNRLLRWNLERAIVTHLQALDTYFQENKEFSLKLLKEINKREDNEYVRTCGNYLKALAIMTGLARLTPYAIHGREMIGPVLEVSSKYIIVPSHHKMPHVLYVDDPLPANSINSPKLFESLNKLWGRFTLLAIGIREFKDALAAKDQYGLTRIRTYLQAELANAGPNTEVSLIRALHKEVDQELAK